MAIVTTQGALRTAGALLLALSVASTAAARGGHDRDRRSSDVGDASGFSLGACPLSSSGHFQFSNSRSPFRGATGGGSYGDVFFAGGATPQSRSSEGSGKHEFGNNSPGGGAPGTGGNGSGANGSGSGTNGNGTSGAPAYTAPGAGGGSGTPKQPTIGHVPGTIAGGGAPGVGPTSVGTTPTVNPEPASMLLIGTGLGALFLRSRRRTRD